MKSSVDVDYLVIGGGFYGCCLALFLRSVTKRVLLVESGSSLMQRASRVNQARLHSGFHYPRSMITALKSRKLCHRFASDFPDAVVSDFQMLYAVARQRSKVSANRFSKMFENMGAPITNVSRSEMALFNLNRIEAVFRADEFAFDYSILARNLQERLNANGIEIRGSTDVLSIEDSPAKGTSATVYLSDGTSVQAKHVFNVTYAQINHILRASNLPQARLKHEVSEIVLVDPPAELRNFGITVMDGPFFSMMPYPAEDTYSLTHVRYTPRMSWTDQARPTSPYAVLESATKESRMRHMVLDAARYMPCISHTGPGRSIFDVKTVLVKNEVDDGRPILVHREPADSRVTSVLGGKIDNIYDLFSHLRSGHKTLADAHANLVVADA